MKSPNLLSDIEVLDMALIEFQSDAQLAAFLKRQKKTPSVWRARRRLPRDIRRILIDHLGTEERSSESRAGVEVRRSRFEKKKIKVHEQLNDLLLRTRARGPVWKSVEAFLDAVQPWTADDDQRLVDLQIEWMRAAFPKGQ